MFKVNNKDTFFTLCSSASIVNFEQINADWVERLVKAPKFYNIFLPLR